MSYTAIRLHWLRLRLPGFLVWFWLGVRTRWAARSEANTKDAFMMVNQIGVIERLPAAYQRLLQARIGRWVQTLGSAGQGILLGTQTACQTSGKRLDELASRLERARRSVPEGEEPPGLLATIAPLAIATVVAMPLTWPFAESLGDTFLTTVLLVVGTVVMEVFAAERAGSALGKLILNEPDTPTMLLPKEAVGARLQLTICGTGDVALMGCLGVVRASHGPLVLWLAIGAISIAIGLFAGVTLERARPWRRMRRLERRHTTASETKVTAENTHKLAERRIYGMGVSLIERISETDERAGVVFVRRWRRRHEGIPPQPPALDLSAALAEIRGVVQPQPDAHHKGQGQGANLGFDVRGFDVRTERILANEPATRVSTTSPRAAARPAEA